MFAIRAFAQTGSTNDDALPLLGLPEHRGAVLLADYQTGGKGRHARAWIAPPGSSLLFTALLPEPIATDALWSVPFWTALAVADGIAASTGLRTALQWPNDLLLACRKCAGILCVSRVAGEQAWVGCGVGVNVLRPTHDSALTSIEPPPAFLSDAREDVERGVVLAAILSAFERGLPALAAPASVARAWEARAELDGTPYRLLVDGTAAPIDAIARRIAPDGALVVDHAGRERTIALADARVLRA